MKRVAAFDCGTNSLRLLVADLDVEAGPASTWSGSMRIVRLGQGVDRTGRIADASMRRVFHRDRGVHGGGEASTTSAAIRFCATSAAATPRTPRSSSAASGSARRHPEVLDGDEEAESASPARPGLAAAPGTAVVLRHRERCDRAGPRRGERQRPRRGVAGHRVGAAQRAPPAPAIRPPTRRSRRPWPASTPLRRLLGRPGPRRGGDRGRGDGDHARRRRARPARLRRHPDPPQRAAARRRPGGGGTDCSR